MSKVKNKRIEAQQLLQESKVKKNAKIIAILFWFGSSIYIYSSDVGFSDVYSWNHLSFLYWVHYFPHLFLGISFIHCKK